MPQLLPTRIHEEPKLRSARFTPWQVKAHLGGRNITASHLEATRGKEAQHKNSDFSDFALVAPEVHIAINPTEIQWRKSALFVARLLLFRPLATVLMLLTFVTGNLTTTNQGDMSQGAVGNANCGSPVERQRI